MARKASPTVIGAFVVAGLALTVVSLVIFGGGNFFRRELQYVAYFSSSVRGLDVGSPVRLEGVTIGTVRKIGAVYDIETQEVLIPVFISFDQGSIYVDPAADDDELPFSGPYDFMQNLIDKGLRAELAPESLITGKLYIALDYHPQDSVKFVGAGGKVPEFPTRTGALERLAKNIGELPVQEILEGVEEAVQRVNELLADPELEGIAGGLNTLVDNLNERLDPLSDSAQATLEDARSLLKKLEGEVDPLSESAQATLEKAQETLADLDQQIEPLGAAAMDSLDALRQVLARVDRMTGGDYKIVSQVSILLEESARAARALRQLGDYLKQHPEALLKGKK